MGATKDWCDLYKTDSDLTTRTFRNTCNHNFLYFFYPHTIRTFNQNFAEERENYLLDLVRENRGCFNVNCCDRSASKRCSKCQVAVYCSRDCQREDWKRAHKTACKLYCDNTATDTRPEGSGQKGAVAIGLFSIGLIDEDILD